MARSDAAGDDLRGDDALVIALAAGATVTEAASRAGVSRKTAQRRLADPAITQRVREEHDRIVRRAVGRLTAASVRAADTLLAIAEDAAAPAAARVTACRTILDAGLHLRAESALADRVGELERTLGLASTNGGAP